MNVTRNLSLTDKVHLIRFPRDATLNAIFKTYKTSRETARLGSELNRTVFADEFLDESSYTVPRLEELCCEIVGKNYNGGPFDPRMDGPMQILLSDYMPVDLDLVKVLQVDSWHYWKKVFVTISKDRIFVEKTKKASCADWKSLGVTEKVIELIENTEYEAWNEELMDKIFTLAAPFVYVLKIMKLKSMKEYSIERDPNYLNLKMYDYPANHCHHGNLKCIGNFNFLTTLVFEFNPHNLELNYHSRHFNFSKSDVINLVSGMEKLELLKTFKIRRSRMDSEKLAIIVNCIKTMNIEHLDFYFCQLKDECGQSLIELLESNQCLKSLELSGNRFTKSGMKALAHGLKCFKGKLEYLGLEFNPLGDDGVAALLLSLEGNEQITKLKLSGISVSPEGAILLADFVKYHKPLEEINIVALPFGEQGGNRLIKALDANKSVLHCDFREGDMSVNQEYALDILLKRNQYIKENPYLECKNAEPSLIEEEYEDSTFDPKDVQRWITRIKNPILLHAMQEFNKKLECRKLMVPFVKSQESDQKIFTVSLTSEITIDVDIESISNSSSLSKKKTSSESRISKQSYTALYKFNPNELSEADFIDNVQYANPNDFSFFAREIETKRR